jgi:hypothetical protein
MNRQYPAKQHEMTSSQTTCEDQSCFANCPARSSGSTTADLKGAFIFSSEFV